MANYQRPGGANWRKRGRGIVPTQAPFQQRKPGMVTGQQPQAAQPTLLDKKLNPAQYPTLNTSPGVEKTNFGLPPLQGQVPGFDADVQKRRAEAFEAARKARQEAMQNNNVGVAADKRAQDFVDKVRNTDPGPFKGLLRDPDTGSSAHHPLHKGEGTPNEPRMIDDGAGGMKRNPKYVPPDNRQIYEGMYSPKWHHEQQNIVRAKQIQKGVDEGRIMRPTNVGLAGYTKGGNFRQPANQWALGNIEARTANALKAGFQPIMGQVRDGTGRMVEDIIGYEKIGDVERREAMKAPSDEGKKIMTDPQDNPFTQTPELPGIDNAGPDIEFTKPTDGESPLDYEVVEPGGSSDNLDMPGFSPEPLPAGEVPGGSVSAPSGGVELAPPAFGPEEGGVNLNQDGGMVIPNLTGEADPSMDLPPQGPAPDMPSPQPPMSAEEAPAPEYEVEGEGNPFDMQEDIDRQEYEQNPSRRRNPFDMQEDMQNPYSPNYEPSGVAPAQGEVPNDMGGVGDKLKEENQKEIDDAGSFQPEHQVPPGVEFNNPKDRMPPMDFNDTTAPEIGGGPETFPEVPAMPMQPDGLAPFPESPPRQPDMEGAPPLVFPPQSGPVINPVDRELPPELPEAPPLPGTALEDLPVLPESERQEYDIDDIGDTELPPYQAPDPGIELEEAPMTQEEGLAQGLQSQIDQINEALGQMDPSSPEYAETLKGRQQLMEQLLQGQ